MRLIVAFAVVVLAMAGCATPDYDSPQREEMRAARRAAAEAQRAKAAARQAEFGAREAQRVEQSRAQVEARRLAVESARDALFVSADLDLRHDAKNAPGTRAAAMRHRQAARTFEDRYDEAIWEVATAYCRGPVEESCIEESLEARKLGREHAAHLHSLRKSLQRAQDQQEFAQTSEEKTIWGLVEEQFQAEAERIRSATDSFTEQWLAKRAIALEETRRHEAATADARSSAQAAAQQAQRQRSAARAETQRLWQLGNAISQEGEESQREPDLELCLSEARLYNSTTNCSAWSNSLNCNTTREGDQAVAECYRKFEQ